MYQIDSSLGSYAWGLKKGGRLSFFNQVSLALKGYTMLLKNKFAKRLKEEQKIQIDPTSIELPDSQFVRQTLEYIRDVHAPALQNHCLRSYVLGELFGRNEKLHYDPEVFALTALLHDVGLEEKHCQLHPHMHCFGIEGAIEAGIYLNSLAGLSPKKIAIVQDSIALHLNVRIPDVKAEAYLINKASATDTIGQYKHELSKSVRQKLLEKYPYLGIGADLNALLKKQNEIRPKARIAFLYKFGDFEKNLLRHTAEE